MKKLFTTLLAGALFTSFTATAQDEVEATEEAPAAPLEFSGSVDTYYRTTLNTKDNGASAAPRTSFADGTGFNIGMINLIASKEGEKAGFVADLVFGPRGDAAVFNAVNAGGNPANAAIVNQLYAYWNVSDKVTLTAGNFNTFLGYEVISPTANFNYSTSYAFSYGPFSHTGLKADFALSDKLSAALAIMNPTDATTTTTVNSATFGAQVGYTADKGGAWLNFLYGDQDGNIDGDDAKTAASALSSNGATFQVDLTTGWDLTDAVYVGFNGTINTTFEGESYDSTGADLEIVDYKAPSFYAAGVYFQYALSDAFAVGLRGEYFSESNGGAGAIGTYATDRSANVIDLTLSANYTVGGLTFIPEFRLDATSEDSFTDKDGNATSSLMSVALAAVYAF